VTKLPKPIGEVPRDRSLDGLAPKFRAAVERMLDKLHMAGFTPLVFETLRTPERQAYLYGFGRLYDDGRGIVTQAPNADTSWHGYGLAVDVVCARRGHDAPESFWFALGCAAREQGLVWGGDWPMRDKPHVQWGEPMRRSPSPNARALRDRGGLQLVWHAVQADD
jgi:hypothetical protein